MAYDAIRSAGVNGTASVPSSTSEGVLFALGTCCTLATTRVSVVGFGPAERKYKVAPGAICATWAAPMKCRSSIMVTPRPVPVVIPGVNQPTPEKLNAERKKFGFSVGL